MVILCKIIDYAFCQFWKTELTKTNIDEIKGSYYNKNHIGKIEIIFFENKWTENQIKDKINDDLNEYGLSYHLSKYTKYSGLEIQSVLTNFYQKEEQTMKNGVY